MTLAVFAWVSLGVAGLCTFVIAVDEIRHPQSMAVMNVVWPVTALYFSVFALWAYFRVGRRSTRSAMQRVGGMHGGAHIADHPTSIDLTQVAVGTCHCGAGCALADLATEFAIGASGLALFGSLLWTEYLLDFVVAWALGIVFQYLAIRPMRQNISAGQAVWAAVKADTLSITAFQVGMYLWMALVYFKLFPGPHHLTPFDPRYWFMMQVAMVCGFVTSFPINRWLISRGFKEAM